MSIDLGGDVEAPAADRDRVRRDFAALLLIVAGIGGLIAVCFAAHPLAGAAAISATAIVGGVLLGLDR